MTLRATSFGCFIAALLLLGTACDERAATTEVFDAPLDDLAEVEATTPCSAFQTPGLLSEYGGAVLVGSEVVTLRTCVEAQVVLLIESLSEVFVRGGAWVEYCNRCEADVFFLGYGTFEPGMLRTIDGPGANCSGLDLGSGFVQTEDTLALSAKAWRLRNGTGFHTIDRFWSLARDGDSLSVEMELPEPWFGGDAEAYLQRELEVACVDEGITALDEHLTLHAKPRTERDRTHVSTVALPPISLPEVQAILDGEP